MTIEEKTKAYDEAYKRAAIRFGSNVADELFPELKESEDERIRKALIKGFNKLDKSATWYNGITNGQIIAWLEKQGEQNPLKGTLGDVFDDIKFGIDPSPKQKPMEWSEEDERMYSHCMELLKSEGQDTMQRNWLKSLKQRIGG